MKAILIILSLLISATTFADQSIYTRMIGNLLQTKNNINCMNSGCSSMYFDSSKHLSGHKNKLHVDSRYKKGCITDLYTLPNEDLYLEVSPYEQFSLIYGVTISDQNIKSAQSKGDEIVIDLDHKQYNKGATSAGTLILKIKDQGISELTLLNNYGDRSIGLNCSNPVKY
jgi:hypothetical protein